MEPHPFVKCGDPVSIRFGPLAGIEGVLKKVKNQYRVILSVELLQKSVAVEVEFSAIERLNRPSGTAECQYSVMRRRVGPVKSNSLAV
jgi:transcription elongation factor